MHIYFQKPRSLSFQFEDDGYLIIEDFFSADDVETLRKEMHDIVENMDLSDNPNSVFLVSKEQVIISFINCCSR